MDQEHESEFLMEEYLKTLGVKTLYDWDVLVFLYRHQASMVSAEHIARLLGYATQIIVRALDTLEALGLVARSRVSQGARLYQFTAPESGSWKEPNEFINFTGSRSVRLYLIKKLKQGDPTCGADKASEDLRVSEGGKTWLKAN